MKVLVLGANGMAGHMVYKYLSSVGYDVTPYTRKELDIEKGLDLPRDFDVIINCIGVLLPDAKKDMERTVSGLPDQRF